ncbi:hypothetical protein EV663_10817 [Rhodovulum bhavnagarense]|uniref:Uncharacterized protein n=1 Tax=Rhodovulum bhavnagarense TaxID=992286 RepID=A0A4R2RLN9_9RHOB|nr:hypothetical protein [Rhodovulum bhavnagarense]TCP60661.1 hypothetical protein EV663_10817 [Rhodovulum bhavnagarense]
MCAQLTKIGNRVIGLDGEGYEMLNVPFSNLPVSVAHYHEAPRCDVFFEHTDVFPVCFEFEVVGVKLAFEPTVAWHPRTIDTPGAERELEQARREQDAARATAMTRAVLPGWVPPEQQRHPSAHPFWAGVREAHSGVYYLDVTEYPDDKAAGLAAAKIADRLIRQAAQKYLMNKPVQFAGGDDRNAF